MPGPPVGDAIHVAVACIHSIDYLLSWNVRHLANPNKLLHLRRSASALGSCHRLSLLRYLLWETRGDSPNP